jgi:tRNA (guanine-N7-)-methyltransferase
MSRPTSPVGPLFHGRRRGRRLRPARQALMDRLLPTLTITLPPDDGVISPRAIFGAGVSTCEIEIGFGGGEHLAAQAAARPAVCFIGCEPFVNGVARLLGHIDAQGLDNIRIWPEDARLLLAALAADCVDRVYVLFADPWPKSRHAKRRIVSTETLDALARVMTDGAELRFASDDMGYVRWTLAHLLRHPDFEWTACGADDWRRRPADWPATRYEAKAVRQGRRSVYLRARRRSRGTGDSP